MHQKPETHEASDGRSFIFRKSPDAGRAWRFALPDDRREQSDPERDDLSDAESGDDE